MLKNNQEKLVEDLSQKLNYRIDINSNRDIYNAFQNINQNLHLDSKWLKHHKDDSVELSLLFKAKDINTKLSMYSIEKLKEKADSNNRIHADFYISNNKTGRLVCKSPALQGLPSDIRKNYIVAEDGCCLITGDYSTMELRVLAKLSQDHFLSRDLIAGKDIHTRTASALFSKPEYEITKQERDVAKSVNFMIIYGGSSTGLSKKLSTELNQNFTIDMAKDLINNFYYLYTDVYIYHYKLENGIVLPSTLGGHTFTNICGAKVKNYPVQASAAECFLKVLKTIVETKPKDYKLVMCIHDSISLEVPAEKSAEASMFLQTTMERVMGELLYPIPTPVEIKNYI